MTKLFSNTQATEQIIPKLMEYLLYASVIITPLLFLPFLQNVFDTAKYAFLLIIVITSLLLWTANTLRYKVLRFTFHPFTLPLILMSAVILISSFFSPLQIFEDFSGIIGLLFFLNILVLFSSSLLRAKHHHIFLETASVVGILLTVISVLQILNIGPSRILNQIFVIQFAENFGFSPSGSPLVSLSVLITLCVPLVASLMNTKDIKQKLFPAVAAAIIGFGILAHVGMMVIKPEFRPNLLPVTTNWIIAIETLKNFPGVLFGVGPRHFLDAYTRYRPVSLNANETWQLAYQTGTDAPLTLWVSLGSLGLVAWLLLLVQSVLLLKTSSPETRPVGLMVVTALVVQLFIPMNMVLIALQAIAMIFWIAQMRSEHHPRSSDVIVSLNALQVTKPNEYPTEKRMSILTYIVTIVVGLFTLFSLYGASRVIAGEFFFFKSAEATQQNDARKVYEIQQQAIRFNPYRDAYRRAYAQTNFAIAANLAQQGEQLTDEQRTSIAQLLQQAIREGRVAASLNPYRSLNWRVLGNVYRGLVGSTESAEQWAVASYVQAVRTHPNDPSLRVDLGGIFLQLQNYDQAAQLFQQSVQLKPDYANGYYNWAQSLIGLQRYDLAVLAYERVLALVDPGSDDYTRAQAELAEIRPKAQEQLAKQQQPAPDQTPEATISATPEPSPSPIAEPLEEAQPQEAELPEEVDQTDTEILNEEPENLELNPEANQEGQEATETSPSPTPGQ